MKKILSLILLSMFFQVSRALDANWKIYPVFDETVTHVIETPDYVYFTSRQLPLNEKQEVYQSLFRYDKKGEELISLSTTNILNGNSVRDVIYNPDKGYVAVLYEDYNIDLLNNDGSVTNIPFYQQASFGYDKKVNSITIDPANDRLYLATEFGYVAINDKKGEIAESRIYSTPFRSFGRIGDTYLAVTEDKLLAAPADSPRLSVDQYEVIEELDNPLVLYPLGTNVALVSTESEEGSSVKKITKGEEGWTVAHDVGQKVVSADYITNGFVINGNTHFVHYNKNGGRETFVIPSGYRGNAVVSTNMSEFWCGQRRNGLASLKRGSEEWSVSRDWMLPNAPSAFVSTSFTNHPDKGLLMPSYGYGSSTYQLFGTIPYKLNGYKQGRWSNYSQAYTDPGRAGILKLVSGLAVDPDNRNYVYLTSYNDGVLKLNLNDPKDVLHMAWAGHGDAGKDGFVELPYVSERAKGYAKISAPFFDKQGNLWMHFADWDGEGDPKPNFYCWLASDRKASTSAASYIPPKRIVMDTYYPETNFSEVIPLTKTGNGLIVMGTWSDRPNLLMINTNGTPTDVNDDKYYYFPSFVDSDGNSLDLGRINYLYEDPSTGYVWVCHANGVCYFVPSQVASGNYQLTRVKVARNDGTNLADYLLEGVNVKHVASDNEGRKWFSTGGGGVICTSYDGREILEEFNTSNSPLPDDIVYGIGYNSENNSLMISTRQGFAEYSLPVSQSSSQKADIKAYPNPVRPEYSGYVTITDIPQGSFVKIADVAGNLVKDLGIMTGFEMLWDLSDAKFNRVRGGVYYILISPSDETSKYSTAGKILVIS